MTLLTGRPNIDEELLLKPLAGDSRIGKWLRYEPVYDEIRHAREHENPYLSRGIWKRELKQAEWALVESLSYKCLTQDTKDLQVMAWLMESWIVLDGMTGFIKGIRLLTEMTKEFWLDGFPYPEDPEARYTLFEWVDRTSAERMYFFAISMPKDEFQQIPWVLAEWRQAQRVNQILKRTLDPKKELERAQAAGEPVMPDFESTVSHTPPAFFEQALAFLSEAKVRVQELKTFLDEHLEHAPSFSVIKEVFSDFDQIWRKAHQTLQPQSEIIPASPMFESVDVPVPQPLPEVRTRDQAYKQIQEVADLLHTLEPQGITPHILNRVAKWKDKGLSEILQTFTKNPSESALLLQLLLREEPDEKPSS